MHLGFNKVVLGILFSFVFFPLWSQTEKKEDLEKKETKSVEKKIDVKQVSYAIGVSTAQMIQDNLEQMPGGTAIDREVIIEGLRDQLRSKARMTKKEASSCIYAYFEAIQKEQNDSTKVRGLRFLEENKKKKGVQTTKSGLQYEILKEGEGPRPTVEDTVVVHYKGMLLSGEVFDSSYDREKPTKFNPLQVIPGWTEGLCLLNKGSKAIFYIPSELAYGDRGVGSKIPPFAVLKFEVELIDVIKGEAMPIANAVPEEKKEN